MSEIEKYLNKLKEQLEHYGVFKNQIIIDNIKLQMYSLIELWQEQETRNGILLFSLELAEFYQPSANILKKAFVVTTIRNSLLESAGSDFYQDYGFERRIEDKEIKEITSFAIRYFKDFDFLESSLELKDIDFTNCYLVITKKYPLAWDIVKRMANLKGCDSYFEPSVVNEENFTKIMMASPIIHNEANYLVEDGMTLKYNKTLCEMLENAVSHPEIGFFTESFKFLSRNFEKVLKTMQYLLERNSRFVTFNYYFSNGYISKRKKLLKPAHRVEEIKLKLKETKDISKKHKKAIELLKQLSQ